MTVSCAHCGRPFDLPPSHLRRRKRPPTCSPDCKRASMRGAGHWNYKGGYITSDGYRMVLCPDGTYQLEHRLVASQKLGRPLLPTEIVHHIDHDTLNNRPENLHVFPSNWAHLRGAGHIKRDKATGRLKAVLV